MSSSHSAQNIAEYATTAGERTTIALTDGSRITLAPNSRLAVVHGFGAATRTVTLTGEAYFDVVAKAAAPFVVRTGFVTTQVLGTEFDVRHYAGDPSVRIAVVSGKVAAGVARQHVLSAGTIAQLTDSTIRTTSAGDMGPYTDWTKGRLVFDNVPVSTMLTTVGRWYGYDFQLADSSLRARPIKATFVIGDREKTLMAIEALLEADMVFTGTTVTVRPRHGGRESIRPNRRWDRGTFSPSREVGK